MLSFRDLFQEYNAAKSNVKIEKIEKYIREKCEKNDYFALDSFDLIYLYRQARFFNLQSELSTNKNSSDYKAKEEKIISFYSLIDLDNENFHSPHFEFDKKTNNFLLDSFLNFLVQIVFDNFEFSKKLINQMALLFDTESLAKYSTFYIQYKLLKNQPVEEIFCIILESWFDNVQIDEYRTQLILYAKGNAILTTPELRENYCSLFNKLNYEQHHLTPKSQCFLLLANECSDILSNSAFFDYSIVSLQYYKIIETEIKQKLLRICSKNIGYRTYFTESLFINKNETEFKFLSLEGINIILDQACKYLKRANDGNNKLLDEKDVFFQSLHQLCNYNLSYLEFFRDITSEKFRNKYRNPPAHTEPLNNENLQEAKQIYNSFIENLRRLNCGEKDDATRPLIIDKILNEKRVDETLKHKRY